MEFNCSSVNSSGASVTFQGIIFITINALLLLFICSGNILTIVAVARTPILQTVPNMHVVSLAVADFLAGMVLPLQIMIFIPSLKTQLDNEKYFCLLRHSTFFVSVTASVLSMVTIAFDRAFYIGAPFKYQRLVTFTKAKIVIACIWIAALILGTLPLYYNNWKPCEGCHIFLALKKEFQIYILNIPFIISCVMTFCCYGYIIGIAKQQQNKISELETGTSKRKCNSAKDFKLIRLFALVFGIFFICWLPVTVAVTIGHLEGNVPQIVTNITVPIAILNSGMNFVVYAVKNRDFRRAFIKMVCIKRLHEKLLELNRSSA